MHEISVDDAKGRLPDLIREALRGENVIITDARHQAVRLVPYGQPIARVPGSGRGEVQMTDDFDAPLPDFEAYMP